MTIPDAAEIVAELERILPDWIDLEPGPPATCRIRPAPGLELPLAWLSPGQQPTLVESMRRMGIL
ncbi:MAG TPA: hypothetical protein PLR07_11965 [Promineifilum sp.]|nr:hypothetical protein [Promineifilum sp.]HRO24997.1 hypothetical protein [Promineifilum sp.]